MMENLGVFDEKRCTLCGECFHQCPAMNLPLEVAEEEPVNFGPPWCDLSACEHAQAGVLGTGPPWCDPHCGLGQGFRIFRFNIIKFTRRHGNG